MVSKIEKIEDEMMNPKGWEMAGEATARDRPINSLLEVHLDFNAATKLPPVITKETTNAIEALIKQRILDEIFDDPVLKMASKRKKLNDDSEMDFTKSKKGLGDIYADDLTKRLSSINPEAILE
jgi:U3 small nucleolar RNA-associated protein MPP10